MGVEYIYVVHGVSHGIFACPEFFIVLFVEVVEVVVGVDSSEPV